MAQSKPRPGFLTGERRESKRRCMNISQENSPYKRKTILMYSLTSKNLTTFLLHCFMLYIDNFQMLADNRGVMTFHIHAVRVCLCGCVHARLCRCVHACSYFTQLTIWTALSLTQEPSVLNPGSTSILLPSHSHIHAYNPMKSFNILWYSVICDRLWYFHNPWSEGGYCRKIYIKIYTLTWRGRANLLPKCDFDDFWECCFTENPRAKPECARTKTLTRICIRFIVESKRELILFFTH